MRFRLLPKAGNHSETGPDGQRVVYKAGDVIESDKDLVAMFKGKFERVDLIPPATEPTTPTVPVIPPPSQEQPPKATKAEAPDKSPVREGAPSVLGRNVTKRFPRAVEEDFVVYANGGAFFVCEADDPNTPLHDKPLKKATVTGFIENYLKG